MVTEEPLLLPVDKTKGKKWKVITWSGLTKELNKVTYIAVPMAVVLVSQFLLQFVSEMMAGHLGELSFSGVAIANCSS
ncbi:hypothetical protein TorRG33x02_091130 [Trema orientale]|uniref:Multi antimicrobial extrusion protein n=1 Tax=Trema orientale TaxID=63057 RepID=A0A2P5FBQ2_TREOI|nr:hypothetical protein TorRG33x02_091130 [Trema orientale]